MKAVKFSLHKTLIIMETTFKIIQLPESAIPNGTPDARPIVLSVKKSEEERILLENNLLPIQFLRQGVKASESVCHIRLKCGDYYCGGTGFMISPNLMMTNHHVLDSKNTAKTADAYFNYEENLNGMEIYPEIRKINTEKFFYAHEELDFAIVAVDNQPGEEFGFIELLKSRDKIDNSERVNIIQHPGGRRKEISLQDNKVSQFFENKVYYFADTQKGSSGAPVFNNRWQIVALHHWGTPTHNEGIRISSICNHIEKFIIRDSERWGDKALTNELLNHIY
jgi:endonuclease G